MRVIELCYRGGTFTDVARARGHEVFTVMLPNEYEKFDELKATEPDLVHDMFGLTKDMIPEKFHRPHAIWASPPCNVFSQLSAPHHIKKKETGPFPKTDAAVVGIERVKETIRIINELQPACYFLENPRGRLRHFDFMQDLPRHTVTYCQYGELHQKATDIWSDCPTWTPRPKCSKDGGCYHRSAEFKGGRRGVCRTQGAFYVRAKVPTALSEEVMDAAEAWRTWRS